MVLISYVPIEAYLTPVRMKTMVSSLSRQRRHSEVFGRSMSQDQRGIGGRCEKLCSVG